MNQLLISDVHLSAATALSPPSGQPYAWLDAFGVSRLTDFLRSDEVQSADRLIIAGDFCDTWVCPMDVPPPRPVDVITAPCNRPVIDALRDLASRKQVVYIPGNHDMEVTADDVRDHLSPHIVFGKHFDEYPLRVRHGHEGCLFNAPDPSGRPFPIGYFITRMTAAGVNRGFGDVSLNLWTVLKNAGEVLELIDGESLAEAVFEVVAKSCGARWSDEFLMPDGSRVSMREACDWYQRLVEDWRAKRGSPAVAIGAEWNPWYDLPFDAPRLHVMGHSHTPLESANAGFYGAYLNAGTWCSNAEATYVRIWDEDDVICGQVMTWNGVSEARSTIARVETGRVAA